MLICRPDSSNLQSASMQVGKDEGKSVVYEFPVDLLREAGVPQGAPPFAVVSSTENDLSIGKCVPWLPWFVSCWLPALSQAGRYNGRTPSVAT